MQVFKPTYPCPLPEGAKVQTTKGRKYLALKDHNGRKVQAFLSKDGTKYLKPQRNYAGRYKDYSGTRRTVTLVQDKEASQAALNELIKNIELLRAGRAIPPLEDISPIIRDKVRDALRDSGQETAGEQLSRESLNVLYKLYIEHLEASGTTTEHRKEVTRCLKAVKADCGFQFLKDICQPPIKEFINSKKASGLSDRTVNVYVDRLRYFCKWAVKNGLLKNDPFADFVRLDEKTNRVREARSLTPEEVEILLEAAYNRPLKKRQEAGYKNIKPATIKKLMLKGEERRLAYALMLYTGLRVNETRQLIWADLNLNDRFVTVRRRTTKNSKPATLPIHSYVIDLLTEWQKKHTEAEPTDRIVKLPASNSSFLKVFNKDLKFAGIEKTDSMGRVVHLHALRHSFSSLLARQGVHPHVLQALARHSRVDTTMGFYTHILRGDDITAIESLQSPEKANRQAQSKKNAG